MKTVFKVCYDSKTGKMSVVSNLTKEEIMEEYNIIDQILLTILKLKIELDIVEIYELAKNEKISISDLINEMEKTRKLISEKIKKSNVKVWRD